MAASLTCVSATYRCSGDFLTGPLRREADHAGLVGRAKQNPPEDVACLEAVAGEDHRRWTLVNGVNDLGVVDPAQIHRGDREVGVT
jgi:hypothetical protein